MDTDTLIDACWLILIFPTPMDLMDRPISLRQLLLGMEVRFPQERSQRSWFPTYGTSKHVGFAKVKMMYLDPPRGARWTPWRVLVGFCFLGLFLKFNTIMIKGLYDCSWGSCCVKLRTSSWIYIAERIIEYATSTWTGCRVLAINVTIWLGELNCELTIWDVSTWPSNLEDTAKMSKIESILVENLFYQVIQIWT